MSSVASNPQFGKTVLYSNVPQFGKRELVHNARRHMIFLSCSFSDKTSPPIKVPTTPRTC